MHAHCEYLEILVDTGILGLAAWGLLIGGILWLGYKRFDELPLRDRLYLGGAMLGVVALLGQNLVCVNLRWATTPFYFYQFLGLIVAYRGAASSVRLAWPVRLALPAVLLAGLWFLTLQPFRSEIALKRGADLQARAAWSDSLPHLQTAIALWPANARARYYLAYSHFNLGDYAKAEEAYRDLQHYSPDYAQIHWNLAAIYLNRGDWDAAIAEYREQQQIGGLPAGYDLDTLKQTLFVQAEQSIKYEAALLQLLALRPNDEITLNMLGNHCFRARRFDEAASYYAGILAHQPQSIPALNNLAGVYFVRGDYSAARDVCLRIVAIPDSGPVPWINLSKAYYAAGNNDKALESLRQAEQLDPDNRELHELYALLQDEKP